MGRESISSSKDKFSFLIMSDSHLSALIITFTLQLLPLLSNDT